MTEQLILDCDPGHDDAVAILLALTAPTQFELIAITVAGGNVPIDLTTDNALRVLGLANRLDVPVYSGCPRPMVTTMVTAEHVHGDSGLDSGSGRLLDLPTQSAQTRHAVNYLIETLRAASEQSIVLVVTGPLTNVATALVMAPDIVGKISRLVMMGGAFHEPGNITPAAEFNIYVDPHAAKVVFESGIKPTVFGLDVTHQMLITPKRLEAIAAIPGHIGSVVADLLEFFNQYDISKYGWDGAPLHDPCTIAYLIDPTIFTAREMSVEIDISEGPNFGRTVADWYGVTSAATNATIVTGGDSDRLFDLLVKRLATI